jgi:hypothetical protein
MIDSKDNPYIRVTIYLDEREWFWL